MTTTPTPQDLRAAADRIRGWVHRTPVLTCSTLNLMTGADLYFKCENLQKVGAFKYRGATNAVLSLAPEELAQGVATHSSGNHAQALALAARTKGVPAYIVMPENAPSVKIAAVKGYGAEVILCAPTLAARESTLAEVVGRTGATVVHPYNDYRIIAGASTSAQELVEDYPGLDWVMCPVGGGGLLSGTALAVKYFSQGTQVFAGEPEGANDAFRSFSSGVWVPSEAPKTIADGLLTSLGEKNFPIIQQYVDGIATCSEKAIVQAMQLIWERMKIVVEPSSAVPLACLLEGKLDHAGKKIGIILSGGNVDLGRFFEGYSVS
jgi:threonine dehydratase